MTDAAASPSDLQPGHAHLAVLGSPIGHSRSPRIHRAAYEVLGLPWTYDAVECAEDQLEGWLAARGPEWRGLSLTMPLKEEAFRLATVRDPVAEESGVANTLLRVVGGRWAAFNTDVAGLAAALREGDFDTRRTVVLGAGATAVSAVLAARSLGAESVTVLARRAEAAQALAARFDATGSAPFTVRGAALGEGNAAQGAPEGGEPTAVISTLPGPAGAAVEVPAVLTGAPLFDVAYDPWPSPLAARWREAGGDAQGGIGMLVHQALVQLRIFLGGDPGTPFAGEAEALAAMRRAVVGE